MKHITSILVLLCSYGNVSAVEQEVENLNQTIQVGLVFPSFLGVNLLGVANPDSYFYVVVHNISSRPQILWTGSAYRGYKNAKFSVTNDKGFTSVITANDRPMGSEPDSHVIVQPNGFFVQVVKPTDADWVQFSKLARGKYTIRATYESRSDKSEENSWSGSVASPEYVLEIR